jgi:hypothetical protein
MSCAVSEAQPHERWVILCPSERKHEGDFVDTAVGLCSIYPATGRKGFEGNRNTLLEIAGADEVAATSGRSRIERNAGMG